MTILQNAGSLQSVNYCAASSSSSSSSTCTNSTTTFISDGTMADSSWSFQQLPSWFWGNDPSYTYVDAPAPTFQSSGGNPGSYREVTHPATPTVNSVTGTQNMYLPVTENPATDSQLSSVTEFDFSLDVNYHEENYTGAGAAVNIDFIATQGTNHVTSDTEATGQNFWQTINGTITRQMLLNAGFDLSSNGAPISFGFATGNSWSYPGTVQLDNFVVQKVQTCTQQSQCSDGIDNDGDTFIDAADPGCHTDFNKFNSGFVHPNGNNEASKQRTRDMRGR